MSNNNTNILPHLPSAPVLHRMKPEKKEASVLLELGEENLRPAYWNF